ncbi:MAG: peptide-methionine (S)-S-oxide reductase MsrA [Limnochordia bacterium]|jgi:peptide-methionine (S)-S-oxide reductase|nr:peptide-methionine (S)-S-oxide reductase MsrA [Limnochordia bacterium]MDD2628982.1 peptide-methionine (S)-S-oxide reductase MsrA [Limnochordia bacterium]MDD4518271.1 peptide-methionine (S)-S-oxide reductase MsrA [Limnochordia bacterium]
MELQLATIGGGCFWCLEAVYEDLKGVVQVESGYSGGHTANPTYQDVCTGETGHAEVVQISFDPGVITYRDILHVFFFIHDPTTLNRQGADRGTQYRSVIFYHDDQQKNIAQGVIQELEAQSIYDAPLVTQLVPFSSFYPAEDYHHRYFTNNPTKPYCAMVIAPKVAKFRQEFLSKLRTRP